MATKKRNQKLFITLTLLIGGIFVILNLVQAVIVIEKTRAKVIADNLDRYESIASDYAYIIQNRIEEYTAHLDFYTKADIVKTKDTQAITDWLHEQKDRRYERFDYVAWVDSTGSFTSDIGSSTNIVDRDYFKAIMRDGKDFYIDDAVTSKTSGKTVLHICKAVKENGKNIGFFCAVINVTNLSNLLDEIKLTGSGAAMLYSGTQYKLAYNGNEELIDSFEVNSELIYNVVTDVKQGKVGNISAVDEIAGQFTTVYAPIPNSNWSMVILLKQAEIEALASNIASMMTLFNTVLGFIIVIVTALSLYKSIKPLQVVENGIKEIASGNADLTKRLEVKSNNEIGRVCDDFNMFAEKLQQIMKSIKDTKDELVAAGEQFNNSTQDTSSAITEIISNIESMGTNINTQSDSVTETAGAVNEIASNIESLNNMIESQSSAVTQASTAVEEMIGNINSVNNSITRMAEEFKSLEKKSILGLQLQDDVSNKIEIVADESEALQEANLVISSIAEQTNLLAMNAAIEAAHAGEAGKGFSVVADEIRKLSETSSQQSDTIGKQLKKIIDSISEIVKASTEARSSFSEVSKGINATTSLVEEISNSMAEQSEGSKQISIALNNMNDTTSQVRTSSYEMSEGNRAILEEIKHLQDATFSMKTGMDEMSVGAKQINQAGADLNEIAGKMESAITQIGNQVDEFKV